MTPSGALLGHLERRIAELDTLFDGIISCHVVVALLGHHQGHGTRYHFSLDVAVPGHELLVGHHPTEPRSFEDAEATADRAFDQAKRQLKDWMSRRHRHPQARAHQST
jgi:ribosome-associated translation inhibitor RaiA